MTHRDHDSRNRILGLDTDVLVHWAMAGSPHHLSIRAFIDREARQRGRHLGLALQVLKEFIHVVTDPRRFERPLLMAEAIQMSRELWHGDDVMRIVPTLGVHDRLCELMDRFKLGRKRILDTALAATLEAAGVSQLATLNGRDFEIYPFIEVIDPTGSFTG